MTASSATNGTHDNGTRSDASNSNQVGPKENSSVRRLSGCCLDFCRSIHTRYIIVIATLFLAFLALIGLWVWKWRSPVCPVCPSCPKDWLIYEGKCYKFFDAEDTWNSSQNNCTQYGADLVRPDTAEEMAFVRRYKDRTDYWIGLWREAVGDPWKWTNGSVFNNEFKIGADGLCAYLNDEDASSTWCHTRRNWICSKFLHAP